MKKHEVIRAISKSQDNDVLTKEFSEDDFLSRYLIKAVDDHTDKETGEVDLSEVFDDLDYAADQITKAREAVFHKMS